MDIRSYIEASWDTMTRSTANLAEQLQECKYDAKMVLFISRKEDASKIRLLMPNNVTLRRLPATLSRTLRMKRHGLLYLPHPYVVPGGRFNEMYGWDSAFIVNGLLESGRVELARNMVDNQIYQINHYGKVLNANRSYYLSRSHPPLLSGAVLAVFSRTEDRDWLYGCLKPLEKYFLYFRKGRKYDRKTGLSHYCDESTMPAYELENSEGECGYYNAVKEHFKRGEIDSNHSLDTFYDSGKDALTKAFYRADRSMRESGFDITDMFGSFSCDAAFIAPVCLNSLLYRMAKDIAAIYGIFQDTKNAKIWEGRACRIRKAMDTYLWDDELQGYFGYDVKAGARVAYLYATMFYPLWAGAASPQQAEKTMHTASKLLAEHGLLTSDKVTGKQWDAPFGWAPLHYFAAHGMLNYGFIPEARDLMRKFCSLVEGDFARTGSIKEKYDVAGGISEMFIKYGYHTNEVGFGWTNAVYLEFKRLLSAL